MSKLKIVYKSPEELSPYVNNARVHSAEHIKQIMDSIETFGWTNPLLLDGDNGIIAGHGRLEAAIQLGIDEIPTIEISGLDESKKRALVLADNKIALNSYWDNEKLEIELQELMDDDFDISLAGFNLDDIDVVDYQPNLNPHAGGAPITDKQVQAAQEGLQSHIESASQQKLADLICPECGCEFQIDKREIV